MSDHFDAYFKWLGIPPAEQPPNHYRLLGIPLFVEDADVISNAADQRMAHLKALQIGKHSALSQKILNEVSSARACLLNATAKAAYDTELANRYEAGIGSALPIETAVVPLMTATRSLPVSAKTNPRPTTSRESTFQQKRLHSRLHVIGYIVVPLVVLSLGALLLILIRGSKSDQPPLQARNESYQSDPGTFPGSAASTTPTIIPGAPKKMEEPGASISHGGQSQSVAQAGQPATNPTKVDFPDKGAGPSLSVTPIRTPAVKNTGTAELTITRPPSNHNESPDQHSEASATQASGKNAALSLEAKVEVLEQLVDKTTEATAFRSIAEQGALLLQQAIRENRKDVAQRCSNVGLAAARRCECPDLLRQITLLILEAQRMESK